MSDADRPASTRAAGSGAQADRPTGAGPERSTEDMHSGEGAKMRDLDSELAVQLSDELRVVREHLLTAFPAAESLGFRGELTLIVRPERVLDVLRFCRDDPAVRCELLADLSCVHWPGGTRTENAQETTGWPSYTYGSERGRIEVDYIVVSLTHGHRFRVRTDLSDETPRVASATALWSSADFMEREAYDFFGVHFEGHPDLRRLHMPDDWEGHPLRKDYPLGGVDVQYKGAVVPPPDERHY